LVHAIVGETLGSQKRSSSRSLPPPKRSLLMEGTTEVRHWFYWTARPFRQVRPLFDGVHFPDSAFDVVDSAHPARRRGVKPEHHAEMSIKKEVIIRLPLIFSFRLLVFLHISCLRAAFAFDDFESDFLAFF